MWERDTVGHGCRTVGSVGGERKCRERESSAARRGADLYICVCNTNNKSMFVECDCRVCSLRSAGRRCVAANR